jgi:hypothetical protein
MGSGTSFLMPVRPSAGRRAQIGSLIQNYAAGSGVTIDDSVADNVMNVVASALRAGWRP